MDATVTREDDFDLQKFNLNFEKEKERRFEEISKKQQEKLDLLNKEPDQKSVYKYSIGEIFIGIKDSWFDILDDILQEGIKPDIFIKKNRLYFIGMTFVILVSILYIYNSLLGEPVKTESSGKIEIHHIHKIIKEIIKEEIIKEEIKK